MGDGDEYEQFIFEKMSALFKNAEVVQNDKIEGKFTGYPREIDVSIRIPVDSLEVLYIVSCKDRKKRPADIIVLGEFRSVIEDVGAAKGLLFCTSGFYRSNHQYARTLGIELFTIEDIHSERWKVEVEIPVIFVRKELGYEFDIAIIPDAALAAANELESIEIPHPDPSAEVSRDGGQTISTLEHELLRMLTETSEPETSGTVDLAVDSPLYLKIGDIWAKCESLTFTYWIVRKRFRKYVTPDEWSQLRDHVRETTMPLRFRIDSLPLALDDSFSEIPVESDEPEGLNIELEEQLELERIVAVAAPPANDESGTEPR